MAHLEKQVRLLSGHSTRRVDGAVRKQRHLRDFCPSRPLGVVIWSHSGIWWCFRPSLGIKDCVSISV